MAKIVIFSGAGISAESGIPTFRDVGGIWDNYKIEEVCVAGCLDTNREKTIEFYDKRRFELENVKPNKAHLEIAKLKQKYPNEIAVITQNVDDLFEKAGITDVIHIHGFLKEIRCEKCEFVEDIGYKKIKDIYPNEKCPKCDNLLRPNVVFFEESASLYIKAYQELDDCEMIVVIGTSGGVVNTDILIQNRYSILNNLKKSIYINDELYDDVIYKSATEAIDEIVMKIERFLNV